MGRAGGAVRFPDGTIKFCVYHGTSDVMQPTLFDTREEAWDNRHGEWAEPDGTLEDVEIYSGYGQGGTLFDIGEPTEVWWWCEGRDATQAEVLASIESGELLERAGWISPRLVGYRHTTSPCEGIVELDSRPDESLFVEAPK